MPDYKIIGGDGKQYGPVTAAELREWIAEGRLAAHSLAQAEGASEWKSLTTFPEFSEMLRAHAAAAPPVSGPPINSTEWTNQILAREPQLRLGECLLSGWSFFASNAGFVVAGVFLVWFMNLVMAFFPFIGGIVYLLLSGVTSGGLYLACVRRMRGEPVGVGNVFDGFRLCFVQLMLAGALTQLLAQLGLMLCLLPGVYFFVAWKFALPLVADKRLEFWSAMELSRKVVTRVWFEVCVLLLVAFLPFLVAQAFMSVKLYALVMATFREANFDPLRWLQSLHQHLGPILKSLLMWTVAIQAVLVVNLMFAVGAVVRAYENLFGARKA